MASQQDLHRALEQLVESIIVEVAGADPADLQADTFLFPDLADELGFDYEAAGLNASLGISLDSLDLLDIMIGVEGVLGERLDLESAFEKGQASPADLASPARIAEFLARTVETAKLDAFLDHSAI